MGTYEFALPMDGDPEAIDQFAGELLEQLLKRPEPLWQRVYPSNATPVRTRTLYVMLTVDGPMEEAARVLTDAFNATARIVPGARHAGT